MSFQASITSMEIFLLCLPGVQGWYSVTYSPSTVCGVKGASWNLPCRFEHSGVGSYIGGEWHKENRGTVWKYNKPNYPDCTRIIHKLSVGDSGVYHFRFYTTLHQGWMTGSSGVTLSVTDLQVKEDAVGNQRNQNQTKVTCSTSCSLASHYQYVWYKDGQTLHGETTASILLDSTKPSEAANYSCAVRGFGVHRSPAVCVPEKQCWAVKCSSNSGGKRAALQVTMTPETGTEGGEVTLTCSTCTHSNNPTFIWYKNEHPVSNQNTTRDNKLHLNPVSSEDAGSYSCAVKGDESLSSTAVFLNVTYVPKNVSVSIKASGEIQDGTLVTLTCSSDANPPVHTYTWYMKSGDESVVRGTGESISFNVTSDTSGLYYCEAQNDVGSTNSYVVTVVIKDEHIAAMMMQAGIMLFVILAITLVFATLWLRKKKKKTFSSSPHTTTVISDPGQRGNSQGNEDDVHYAGIQFQPRTKKKSCSSNGKRAQKLKQDEDVVYASIQPSQSNTATWTDGDFPVYAAVNKVKINKVVGD